MVRHATSSFVAAVSDIPAGRKYRIIRDDSRLSFRELFELLRSSEDFADWYSNTLAEFAATAFYWELPPLTDSTIDDEAEFVLIDAPLLARFPPDAAPFASQFDNRPREDVIVFPNLGGDATLVVPSPNGPIDYYPHLATFLRQADKNQIRELWRVLTETVLTHLSETPLWVSTAGGGVAWLHLRLDSRPKYYSHRPYAVMG